MTPHPGERLSAFVDGELSDTERIEIERHLEECPDCRLQVERIRAIAAAAASDAPVDEVTTKRFLAENRKRRGVRPVKTKSGAAFEFPNFIELGVVVGLLAIIVLGVFVALGGPMRNMFSTAVGTGTMGQNQAALSGGIY